jgi:DNA polymerase III delta prime subunit
MQNRLSHAYIIESPSREALDARSKSLAAEMLCQSELSRPCGACRDCRKVSEGIHPDVIFVRRAADSEGKPKREIYVDQIRAVSADAPILPNEAAKKVYIFPEADLMNTSAQNALLKLLEEPPAHVCFILCAENAESLLETIRSRCAHIGVNRAGEREENSLARAFLAAVSEKSAPALVRFCTENEGMDSASALSFARDTRALIADMLAMRENSGALTRRELMQLYSLMGTAEDYLRSNVGVRHVFGLLQTAGMN